MLCIVVLKEKIVPFGKTLFIWRGGHSWGIIQKNLMSLGGQEENVSSKENSLPPGDVINERSQMSCYKNECGLSVLRLKSVF